MIKSHQKSLVSGNNLIVLFPKLTHKDKINKLINCHPTNN